MLYYIICDNRRSKKEIGRLAVVVESSWVFGVKNYNKDREDHQ